MSGQVDGVGKSSARPTDESVGRYDRAGGIKSDNGGRKAGQR